MNKLKSNTIYLPLQGRIGNQLFQYALARRIQSFLPKGAKIIIDDSDVLRCNWVNSLEAYNLPNVEYVHDGFPIINNSLSKQFFLKKFYRLCTRSANYNKKYKIEKILNRFFNMNGMFFCENGYIEPKLNMNSPIYIEGYFQSHYYFDDIYNEIRQLFCVKNIEGYENYPGLSKLRNSNSVCISVKVEHNVGNSMYDVCSIDYWRNAINYIIDNVENPVFFICSDNVEYVLENLIDTTKYECIVQDQSKPVHISLGVMSECKHFIIGNTTFGWWAQYLAQYQKKIVVAPSKWMAIDMPIDLYQNNWHLIDVEGK